MAEYMANQFTAIFPFGIVAKGEFLRQEHIDALGEATLADMVKRGVLSCNDADHEQKVPETATQADTADTVDPEDTGDTADNDDPEDIEDEEPVDLGIDPTDDLVEDEAPATPEPAAKKTRGGKNK